MRMYDLKLKPGFHGDEPVTILITESDTREIQKAQARGSTGVWIGGQYIALSSIRTIEVSTFTPPQAVNELLMIEGRKENPKDERARIRGRIDKMREDLRKKGIVKK